jgi:hypothetical protein
LRFKDIKINDDGVILTRVDSLPDGTELSQTLTNATSPLPSFWTALQAFTGYAVNLVGVPDWAEDAKVVSVHLSEQPKTRKRGLVVTFTKRIERAKNRTVVINTPVMHAPAADEEGVNPGTFEREVLNMIKEVENEATRYWNGDRAQGELPLAPAAQTDDLTKRRGRKSKGEPVEPDDEVLRKLLLAAGRDVPIDAIPRMTSSDRQAAPAWAEAAIDPSLRDRPAEPEWLQKIATPALLEDVAGAQGATK